VKQKNHFRNLYEIILKLEKSARRILPQLSDETKIERLREIHTDLQQLIHNTNIIINLVDEKKEYKRYIKDADYILTDELYRTNPIMFNTTLRQLILTKNNIELSIREGKQNIIHEVLNGNNFNRNNLSIDSFENLYRKAMKIIHNAQQIKDKINSIQGIGSSSGSSSNNPPTGGAKKKSKKSAKKATKKTLKKTKKSKKEKHSIAK
jgi:hypothetical protein